VLGWATGNLDTQDSPRPELGGSHHLSPYSILCASPWGPHPNGFLSRDSHLFPHMGLLQIWERIISCAYLRLRWVLKQSCNPCQELSNSMSHITCTQGNRVNSRFLMVGSQTANLTPNLSFGHNLCFKCPNEQCKPILDNASIVFQWYKKKFEATNFDSYNRALKIREFNSQPRSLLGSVRVHSLTLTLFALLEACDVTPESPS
jgi:hypothetical protein